MYYLHYTVTTACLLLILFCFTDSAFTADENMVNYKLSISFNPAEGRLVGTTQITIPPGQRLTLSFQKLQITGSLLREETGREHELLPTQDVLILPAVALRRTLYLSYVRTVENEFDNLLGPEGISLTGNWYPVPEKPVLFTVTANLPENFSAVMESDRFPLVREGNAVIAAFSKPMTAIHFNAGPYQLNKKEVRKDLFVYSMFFKEDKELSAGYLEAAAAYLARYEREIGPYPYNHYVIVANRLPTGYGMPTFTLLGQAVLRLPFIKATSLGHEIVHSWFGNAVEVDASQGNWCEGLTSFLADHAYQQEQGEGVTDRRESITKYLSYVHQDSAITLADFVSASHRQPMAETKRAVGYIRGALLFHELQEKIGKNLFFEGLRRFYREFSDRKAGWEDLRRTFEQVSQVDLVPFFDQRLKRVEIPALTAEDINIRYSSSGPVLSFTLVQKSAEPFSLVVPIEVNTMAQKIFVTKNITAQSTEVSIPLNQLPLDFRLDPHNDFLRHLDRDEFPAVWSRFMGAEKRLVVLATESDRVIYQPLLDVLAEKDLIVTTADTVTNRELSENNLLFLGLDQPPSRSLFGRPKHAEEGLTLDTRRNPLNRDFVAVLVSSSSAEQTSSAAPLLTHYGKYSFMEFNYGRNLKKTIQPTAGGIHFVLEQLPSGGQTSSLQPFPQLLEQLADSRVIYVGENHTSLSDHRLQLRIIESLFRNDPKLIIGMEMFPASSQKTLDDYLTGNTGMDERTFLRQSDYYNVWRYDYRLYRDIINFARKNGIRIVGLNLERQVVAEVFRSGGIDSLTVDVQRSLPQDRDLDMEGYTERLSLIHGYHQQGDRGKGEESGFIQAQGLWDETMAENIASLVVSRPDHRIVVLAGSQHNRKDSGIPPRVARRVAVSQASVLNIYNDGSPVNLAQVADFFFLSEPMELAEAPKIGIVLDPQPSAEGAFLKITELSPHGKAGEAGLEVGDRITKVNGIEVATMADLHIAMLDTRPGDKIEVATIREKDGATQELRFKIELTNPSDAPPQHP